ncbi:MAG: hypothetical protein HY814_08540 [Candidatus Riflebacteria bacterium]|nr:hypothetical protein [Candidatus Riflebacteria bacterium]
MARLAAQGGSVGEVALPDGSLEEFGAFLQSRWQPETRSARDLAALLVLAVNCAYHRYDSEGFWVHFARLVGRQDAQTTGNEFRPALGRALARFGFPPPGETGAGQQYVGALLREAGMARRYQLKYRDLLERLRKRLDYGAIAALSYDEYAAALDPYVTGGFERDCLIGESGWRFTREVARHLAMVEQGCLTRADLDAAEGFRPEFWELLFSNVVVAPRTSPQVPPPPRFILDADTCRIGLAFDESGFRRRAYWLDCLGGPPPRPFWAVV